MAIQTGGINYPITGRAQANVLTGTIHDVSAATDTSVSTLHLEMRLKAEIGGHIVDLISPMANCGSACRKNAANAVDIVRFAKDGSLDRGFLPFASSLRAFFRDFRLASPRMDWLVTMQQGAFMVGAVSFDTLASGQPAQLTLHGRMLVQVQLSAGAPPVRLLSRAEPHFAGMVKEWPPRGAELALTNGPIEYFNEDDVERPNAEPVLKILSNNFVFGTESVSLLAMRPEITRLHYVDKDRQSWVQGKPIGGAALSWTDTRSLVSPSDPPVRYYHVYRKFDGDDLNGWILVRALPADITSWVDNAATGDTAVEYIVLHAAEYPFGHRYESLMGRCVALPGIAS